MFYELSSLCSTCQWPSSFGASINDMKWVKRRIANVLLSTPVVLCFVLCMKEKNWNTPWTSIETRRVQLRSWITGQCFRVLVIIIIIIIIAATTAATTTTGRWLLDRVHYSICRSSQSICFCSFWPRHLDLWLYIVTYFRSSGVTTSSEKPFCNRIVNIWNSLQSAITDFYSVQYLVAWIFGSVVQIKCTWITLPLPFLFNFKALCIVYY